MLKKVLNATKARKLSKQDLQKINGGHDFNPDRNCRRAGDYCVAVLVFGPPINETIEQEGICLQNGLCQPIY
ncbi:hypothetical protein [Tenacibaculum xiamenense]|uniref:hypothetical protein n=1 Tax=Tenacibaculum xiamenense TaxID=1261553 RepID=UPI00389624D7